MLIQLMMNLVKCLIMFFKMSKMSKIVINNQYNIHKMKYKTIYKMNNKVIFNKIKYKMNNKITMTINKKRTVKRKQIQYNHQNLNKLIMKVILQV